MSKSGPIVIIEDDPDDQEMFISAVDDLGIGNKVLAFSTTEKAMQYLVTTEASVFIIFCDINLPGQDGLGFKKDVDADPVLRSRSIPFVFFSTSANQQDVNTAYIELTIQGFFKKPGSYGDLKSMLDTIFMYWKICKHPNSDDWK